MNRPEYWESDEKWAAYEEYLAQQPPKKEEKPTELRKAVDKCFKGSGDTPR